MNNSESTLLRGNGFAIRNGKEWKSFMSPNYNYRFRKEDGFFVRYGRTIEDDPDYSEFGPEIVDMEITTICHGTNGRLCKFCYKSNNPQGKYMSFETFKKVFHNLPPTVTQIAFGVDAACTSNPDVFKIMKYCREHDVVPNVTVADITDFTVEALVNYCGAVAVSRYDDKNICYNIIRKLTSRGMKQINMHIMISQETLDNVWETLRDIAITKDSRLNKLNAIVFLSLKQKGRGSGFTALNQDQFNKICNFCFKHKIRFGFDSCSAIKFMEAIKDRPDKDKLMEMIEPCESSKFSAYISVDGKYFPCSFIEGTDNWIDGLDVVNCKDFVNDVWNHKRNRQFRNKCIECLDDGKACQVYKI